MDGTKKDAFNVLLVGNNPMEMSELYEKLHKYRPRRIQPSIVFDLKGLIESIKKLNPRAIIIDELFGYFKLKDLMASLAKNARTRKVGITLLKTSGFAYSHKLGVDNYILKEGITADKLYQTIRMSIEAKQEKLSKISRARKKIGISMIFSPIKLSQKAAAL